MESQHSKSFGPPADVVAVIVESAVCLKCIGEKTGWDEDTVKKYVAGIGTVCVVRQETRPCSICAVPGLTVTLRPGVEWR